MGQHIVAIDLGNQAARVVVLEVSMRRAEVRSAQSIDFPPGLALEDIWAHVKQHLAVSVNTLVIGLDARASSTRQLVFPFTDVKRIESAVAFELEGQVPYAIDDVAVTWQICERAPQHTHLLAAVTPKVQVRQQLRAQADAGLEPRVLMLPAAGLAEFIAPTTEGAVALASIGATQTQIAICRKGLRFARTLRLGGGDIDRSLVKLFGIDPAGAKAAKEQDARLVMPSRQARPIADEATEVRQSQQVSDVIMAALSPLVMGFVATFKSLPPEDSPARLLLTGGTSRLPGLVPYLQHRLGIPVELLDMQQNLEGIPLGQALGPEYAVALGMAVSLYRNGRDTPLNFRRNEFAYSGDLQLYRGQLTRAAVGTGLVLCLALMASVVRYTLLRSEERQIDQGFCTATQRIIGREVCDPTAALSMLKQSGGDGGVVIPSFSAAAILEMISRAIGTEIDVQFDELDLAVNAMPGQPDRITGKGEAASFETTEHLVTALRREPCVLDAEVSKQRKGQSAGRVEFSLVIKVACPAGLKPGQQAKSAGGAMPL
jgi:Tfp pilus assembly PilM family ATPase